MTTLETPTHSIPEVKLTVIVHASEHFSQNAFNIQAKMYKKKRTF